MVTVRASMWTSSVGIVPPLPSPPLPPLPLLPGVGDDEELDAASPPSPDAVEPPPPSADDVVDAFARPPDVLVVPPAPPLPVAAPPLASAHAASMQPAKWSPLTPGKHLELGVMAKRSDRRRAPTGDVPRGYFGYR